MSHWAHVGHLFASWGIPLWVTASLEEQKKWSEVNQQLLKFNNISWLVLLQELNNIEEIRQTIFKNFSSAIYIASKKHYNAAVTSELIVGQI